MGRQIMKIKGTMSLRTMTETSLSVGIRMGAVQGLIFLRSNTHRMGSGFGQTVIMGRKMGRTGLSLWRWTASGEFMLPENPQAAALLQSSIRLMALR
jgi:hypothetical protein